MQAKTKKMHQTMLVTLILVLSACFDTNGNNSDDNSFALLLWQASSSNGSGINNCILKTASTPSGTAGADTVVSAPAQTGTGFGAAECLTNGVRGEGEFAGSLDVFSMNATGTGATVILAWDGKKITNGSGIDFVVFENAFKYISTPTKSFMEPVIVEVTQNDTTRTTNQWCGFAPDFSNTPETTYSREPGKWSNFGGITPIKYNQESNALSASAIFDQSQAGGDGFDLDNLNDGDPVSPNCSGPVRTNILSNGFQYIRLQSAGNAINPDTGMNFVSDTGGGTPDIDGVMARYIVDR